jgi:hypothetical protein
MAKEESPTARAERYRSKAEEVRVIAECMKDPTTKRTLLTVSKDYLKMADSVERQDAIGERIAKTLKSKL